MDAVGILCEANCIDIGLLTAAFLRHVVVKNGLLAAIISFNGYARPVLFDDGIRRHQRFLSVCPRTS